MEMSKRIQGIELAMIAGRRGYAPDIIVNTETDEQVAACANPDLTALFVAAPEMFELLWDVRNHIDKTCRECESKAIVPEIDALLDKIEGGEE